MIATHHVPYWGPVTSNIDWCESNYAVTPYIAEFFNTLSSVPIALYGLYGLIQSRRYALNERRHALSFACLIVVGLGSVLFHATLRRWAQATDELPMLYTTLVLLYNMADLDGGWNLSYDTSHQRHYITNHWSHRWQMKLFLLSIGIINNIIYVYAPSLFLVFACTYVGLICTLNYLMVRAFFWGLPSSEFRTARKLYKWGAALYLAASGVWITELALCHHLPSWFLLHSLWHVSAGIATYLIIQTQIAWRGEKHGAHVKFHRIQGTVWGKLSLPFVKINIKDKQ